MKTLTRNGSNIDNFIPRELRQMFYRNPGSLYKYAKHNGYSPYGMSTNGLVMYLPLWALKDTPLKSVDAYEHIGTPVGTAWTPQGRILDDDDDLIDFGVVSALDFTTNFSVLAWVKIGAAGTHKEVVGNRKNVAPTGGYHIFWYTDDKIYGQGNTAAATNAAFSFNSTNTYTSTTKFYHLFFRFDSAVGAYLIVDGTEDGKDESVAAVATSANKTYVGVDSNDGTTGNFGGTMGEVLLYNRTLTVGEGENHRLSTIWRYL